MTARLIAEDGPLVGLILDLSDDTEWVVGRSASTCDLVVDDSTVSRKQAKLYRDDAGIYLENLSKVNPTLVNHEELDEPVLLKENDQVQFGETVFLFSEKGTKATKKKKAKKKSSYDDIFDELNVPEEDIPSPTTSAMEDTILAKHEDSDGEESFYDTIFEEPSVEEQTPFDLSTKSPYLLKVISGPNAGAEIGMEKGHSYVIGKDADSADILFQDLSVSGNHARLTIGDEGMIEIEDLQSKNGTSVGGTTITEKHIVTSSDLISLGTTLFMIIDREGPQETIYAEPPVNKKSDEASKETPENAKKASWKNEPIPYKHLIIAASIAAVFLVAFISFFSLFKSKEIEIVNKEPSSEIHDALDVNKFSGVAFSFNPASGKLFLVGHVLSNVDYQEMRYTLSTIPFITSIEDTVIIDNGVSKMMNDVLSNHEDWKGINVRATKPGKFLATGYLQTSAEMSEVNEYFTQNFPYMDHLENQIAVEEVLNAQIGSLLRQDGFSAVTYSLSNGEILFSGVFDRNKEDAFKELIKHIQHLNAITSVKNFAIPTSPQLAAIDISSQFAVNGITFHDGKGLNVVLNGRLYRRGDAIDGMGIVDIEENTILLEKDGVKYRIDFTQ